MKLVELMKEIEKQPIGIQAQIMVALTRKVAKQAAKTLPPGPVRHAQVAPGVVAELARVLQIQYEAEAAQAETLEMGVE